MRHWQRWTRGLTGALFVRLLNEEQAGSQEKFRIEGGALI